MLLECIAQLPLQTWGFNIKDSRAIHTMDIESHNIKGSRAKHTMDIESHMELLLWPYLEITSLIPKRIQKVEPPILDCTTPMA